MQNKKPNLRPWFDAETAHLDAEIWLPPPEPVVQAAALQQGTDCGVTAAVCLIPIQCFISIVFAEYIDGRRFNPLRIFKAHTRLSWEKPTVFP